MGSEQTQTVLAAHGLTKEYAPGRAAIAEVTLRFGRGDFVAVIGPSGAGKSTLLRCLNLLIRPTRGRVELLDRDITESSGGRLREVRGQVGMVFQGFNLVRRLSVLENVLAGRLRFARGPVRRFAGVLRLFPRSEREIAFACLEKVGIAEQAFKRADQLSGGQQQRVAIARVLAQEPRVILADEPIASLDPESARGVMRTLRAIHDTKGIPVIVNLHQVDVAREFGSRIVGMNAGRVCVDAAVDRVTAEDVERVYTRGASGTGEPRGDSAEPRLVSTGGAGGADGTGGKTEAVQRVAMAGGGRS